MTRRGDDQMTDGDKPCVLCGQSCAGHPRIKNAKGQYAHKSCAQAKQQDTGEPEIDMGDLLGDIDQSQAFDSSAIACPGCGYRMEDNAVVCMGCGHHRQSGKQLKTKASKTQASRQHKAASLGTELASNVLNQLVFPTLVDLRAGPLEPGSGPRSHTTGRSVWDSSPGGLGCSLVWA